MALWLSSFLADCKLNRCFSIFNMFPWLFWGRLESGLDGRLPATVLVVSGLQASLAPWGCCMPLAITHGPAALTGTKEVYGYVQDHHPWLCKWFAAQGSGWEDRLAKVQPTGHSPNPEPQHGPFHSEKRVPASVFLSWIPVIRTPSIISLQLFFVGLFFCVVCPLSPSFEIFI